MFFIFSIALLFISVLTYTFIFYFLYNVIHIIFNLYVYIIILTCLFKYNSIVFIT